MSDDTVVLLPLKGFGNGKSRLAGALDPRRRTEMTRAFADTVRAAADPLPLVVMTADAEVSAWAAADGAKIVEDGGWDLNNSLSLAVEGLSERGVGRVVVAHGDLPLADDLSWVAELDGVVVVPDRWADGTNLLAVPTGVGYRFSYGPASSHHHAGEAWRLDLPLAVVRDPLLAWDVDVPEDLDLPGAEDLRALREASSKVRDQALGRRTVSP